VIVTDRLCLRPFRAQDLPAFAYRSNPEVARSQSWDPTHSLADAEELLAEQAPFQLGRRGSGCNWRPSIASAASSAATAPCASSTGRRSSA
jgi:hypothetical protein